MPRCDLDAEINEKLVLICLSIYVIRFASPLRKLKHLLKSLLPFNLMAQDCRVFSTLLLHLKQTRSLGRQMLVNFRIVLKNKPRKRISLAKCLLFPTNKQLRIFTLVYLYCSFKKLSNIRFLLRPLLFESYNDFISNGKQRRQKR